MKKVIIIILWLACGFASAKEIWLNPVNISILNTPEDDFAPAWNSYEQILYFNSNQTGYSMFYTSHLSDSGDFSVPAILKDLINQKKNNQSFITFTDNNEALFCTFRQTDKYPILNIYSARKYKHEWQKTGQPANLIFENFTSHPTVSPDGSLLLFSTTKNSVNGDADLWMASRQPDGDWGGLIFLEEFNTHSNEITPFFASNDTLFFASDNDAGKGGFDIYRSIRESGIWERPLPVYELNTEYNESDFTIIPGSAAVFASDRAGGKGRLDLYLTHRTAIADSSKPAANVEISLSVQSLLLNVYSKKVSEIFQVSPYMKKSDKQIMDKMDSTPEELYLSDTNMMLSLQEICRRMKKFPDSELYIMKWSPANIENSSNTFSHSEISSGREDLNIKNNDFSFRLIDYISGKYNIDKARIKLHQQLYNPANQKNIDTSYFQLYSPQTLLFTPVARGIDSLKIEPPVLDISLDARPVEKCKHWDCNLYIDDSRVGIIKSGDTLPKRFYFDLKPHAGRISNADSLTIEFMVYSNSDDSISKQLTLNIFHSETKEIKNTLANGIKYENYSIFLPGAGHLELDASISTMLDEIAESGIASSKIIIGYYNTEKSKRSALALKAELTRRLDGRQVQITEQPLTVNPQNKNYNENIFEIRLEKIF